MTEKRYFWLKLKRDFFKRHDIRIVEDMPNGKEYILFYLKLLCESVDHDGGLRFSDEIPYNENMLATITNTNVDVVRNACKIFTSLKMMEVLDDGTIFMRDVQNMIGSESQWAEKKRVYRETQKQLTEDNVLDMSGQEKTMSDKSKSKRQSKNKSKSIYGEYRHVSLSDEEYQKLSDEFGNVDELITFLDEYKEMKGYKCKNDYLAIRKWVVDAVKENSRKANKHPVIPMPSMFLNDQDEMETKEDPEKRKEMIEKIKRMQEEMKDD